MVTATRGKKPPSRPAAPAPAPAFDGLALGAKLQELRTARGRTLDWLARETGFTKGYLSRIENGKKTPPIGSLARVARALEVDLSTLLQAQGGPAAAPAQRQPLSSLYSVVRAAQRPKVVRGASAFGYNYVGLADFGEPRQMAPFLFTFPKEIDKMVFFEHEGEEFLFILSGQVEWQMAHEKFLLQAGDSVYLDSRVPHRGRAIGGEATALVVVYSPHYPDAGQGSFVA
ncbi:MAG TPA: XRE family transcriptional regulator [Ramlibacter sp.]|nr:XRE family transcriptional regulator [Ramlibacter sp.]